MRSTSRGAIPLSSVWAATALLVPCALVTLLPLQAVDLAYQLRAGDLILRTGGLPGTDTFTFTAAGSPWLDQQWGAQVALAAVFAAGGWLGLALLRSLVLVATVGLVYLTCRATGASRRLSGSLTLAGSGLILGGAHLRPQLLGLICFAATMLLVIDRERHPARLLLLPFTVAIWANVHGSFVLGVSIALLAGIEDLWRRRPGGRRIVALALATVAATLVNPYGIRVWGYAIEFSANPLLRELVREWSPPTLDPTDGAAAAATFAFLVAIAAAAAACLRAPRGSRAWAIVWLAALALPGAVSVRGMYWFGVGAPTVVARAVSGRTPRSERPDPGSRANTAIVAVPALLLVVALARWLPHAGPEPPYGLLSYAPEGVTAALSDALEPGDRIFNAQPYGSWLEWALPDNPVAVDSRIEVIPDHVWRDYLVASAASEEWSAILDRWDVSAAALRYDQQAPLIRTMRSDARWILRYEGPDGVVFVRP